MNFKKYITSAVATLISVYAFAYPTLHEEDPVSSLLQQYATQMQELQKNFEQKLLPTFKSMASLALQVQTNGQAELTAEQEALFETYVRQLDKGLTDLVSPALTGLDVAQFNVQYAKTAKAYGFPAQQFTLQDIADLLKGMYLAASLSYFEQAQQLTEDEATVLIEIFFPQEEENNAD